jgi:Do/DeqQ family serine protease
MFTRTHALRTLALVFLVGSSGALAQLPFFDTERPSLAPMLKEVTPAVVNISVVGQSRVGLNPLFDDPFFRRFFDIPEGGQLPPQQSAGSGVIIDAESGYVLTNHHVVESADEIVVTLADRRRFDAELVGSDADTDIALLKIDAGNLTEIEMADSATLEVGDFVVAIGNPFGLGQTVTSGIVSALGRSGLQVEGRFQDFIQTDASINPGNSGGALVDVDGKLVGINTAIVAPAGGNVGIGFAVPVNMAREVTTQLLEYGEVRRGRLGIQIQDVTPDLAEALDLDIDRGAVITQVEPGSAAESAGLRAGDVIVEFNGTSVAGSNDLANKVGLVRVGAEVEIAFLRDGQRREVTATIGAATGGTVTAGRGATIERIQGAQFRNLDSTHPQYGRVQGVLIASVEPGSPAARNGLRQGDIITAVNRQNVTSVEELTDALGAAGAAIALNIVRDDARLFIVIQ